MNFSENFEMKVWCPIHKDKFIGGREKKRTRRNRKKQRSPSHLLFRLAERPPVVLAFLEEPKDVAIKEGTPACREVLLRCVLKESDPTAVSVWFFNSKPLDEKSHPGCEQSFDGRAAQLRLREVGSKMAGVYSCGVKNPEHTCICMCKLSVEREFRSYRLLLLLLRCSL